MTKQPAEVVKVAQQESMSLMDFMTRYGTNEACGEHLYQMRWGQGFVCPKCGAKGEPFHIKSRGLYQCKHCNHQASVTAGTIMDRSRTPLTKWFMAIYLMGQDKRGCSALKLKRELGIAYDTAWTMSHKIRKAMAERDGKYQLAGIVDVDEAFFGAAHAGSKRGRGTDKTAVVFGVSCDKSGRPQFLKVQVVPTVSGKVLTDFAKSNIQPGSLIRSDGLNSYRQLTKEGYLHEAEVFDGTQSPDSLKWLHTIISNVKAMFSGTYHGLSDTHLQAFFDEFVFRFNRRTWPAQLFNRTVSACANSAKFTRYDLIGKS